MLRPEHAPKDVHYLIPLVVLKCDVAFLGYSTAPYPWGMVQLCGCPIDGGCPVGGVVLSGGAIATFLAHYLAVRNRGKHVLVKST